MKLKFGIFGGTFNPIHIGHLLVAEYVLTQFLLDKIIFVPTYIPPHKKNWEIVSPEHRCNMIKIALKNNKNFVFSDFEIKQKTKSYTVYTLENFYNKKHKLFLLIGDEWLKKFNTWHRYEEIFKISDLIVIRRIRNGEKIPKFLTKYKNKIHFSNNPIIEISSSMIRERLSKNLSVKYMIPEKVLKYIQKEKLYGK